jgi:hypothetical protein
MEGSHNGNNNQLITVHENGICKSCKQHMEVYYCIPLEDGLRTETCSGSNDKGGGGLLR